MPRGAGHHCSPRTQPDVAPGGVTFHGLVPRFRHDAGFRWCYSIGIGDDEGDHLVGIASMTGLRLVVVEPRFVVQHRGGRPLRRIGASVPEGWRIVCADDAMVWVFIVNHLSEFLPEGKGKASVVVHVVLSREHPDHIVCTKAVYDVPPPAFDSLRSRCVVKVFATPPSVNPYCDPLLVRILDHPFDVTDVFRIKLRIVFGKRRTLTAPAVARNRSEEHTSELQSRENLVCR